ncbi:hypothetical protein LTR66_013209 [Elasticomyces elasticus]|nr:hypothetical protein LTR66_013209 [Elasticomyces elasticus]
MAGHDTMDICTSSPETSANTGTTAPECRAAPADAAAAAFVFSLFDLPAELRLEIYHAALVRPYPIYLHREPPPPPPTPAVEEHSAGSHDDGDELMRALGTVGADIQSLLDTNRTTRSGGRTRSRRIRVHGHDTRQGFLMRSLPVMQDAQSSASIRSNNQSTELTKTKRDEFEELLHRDPLVPALLRTNKQVYKEARNVFYGDNTFIIRLETGIPSLMSLHQRNRRLIKTIELTIPIYHDILEKFAEVVRLSLRYCWGLQKLVIKMPLTVPSNLGGADADANTQNNVYANAFNILRWLPQNCEVIVDGEMPRDVRAVVDENALLAKVLDEKAYARRQHQMQERSEYPGIPQTGSQRV